MASCSPGRWAASLGLALGIMLPATAAMRDAHVTGMFERQGEDPFGLTCPCNLQANFQLDDSVAPLYSARAGVPFGELTWATDLFAYSKAALVGFSITMGTETWTADDLIPVRPRSGLEWNADFITDAPLAGGSPSRMWMYFQNEHGQGSLFLGRSGDPAYLDTQGWIQEWGSPYRGAYAWDTLRLEVQPAAVVPEPATLAQLLAGLLVVGLVTRRCGQESARLRACKSKS